MSSPSNKQKALAEAVSRLLRPIVRMLLRNSMPFAGLEALAKQVYVEVAFEEFAIPGKRPTISRASVLSGLTRKEVQRLVNERMIDDSDRPDFRNRAMRVLTAWVRDPKYRRQQQAAWTHPEGAVSFSTLVKRQRQMPPGAVMDELLRVGAIRRVANGQLALAQRAYVPAGGQLEKLAMLGTDVADLIETIDHNVEHGAQDPRFQRKVMYTDMSVAAIPAFRKVSATKAQALLEHLDIWLAKRATRQDDDGPAAPRARIGLGVFYFEQLSGQPGSTKGIDDRVPTHSFSAGCVRRVDPGELRWRRWRRHQRHRRGDGNAALVDRRCAVMRLRRRSTSPCRRCACTRARPPLTATPVGRDRARARQARRLAGADQRRAGRTGQTQLPAGKYTQLRLVLAANDATHPFANSVVPSGGSEVALTTPSGQQ